MKKEHRFNLPPINDFSSRKKWEETCWKKIRGSGELLDTFMSSYERRNVVMRAAAVDRIRKGMGNRYIAKELWLSRQTISSIKKALHERVYKSYRERGKSERTKKVYSRDFKEKKRRVHGRRMRTKYGTLVMPS